MTPATLALACFLDALVGDPRWLPHPVRIMGAAIHWIDTQRQPWCCTPLRELTGGILLAFALPALAFCATWGIIALAGCIHVLLGVAASILLAWTTLGGRDLVDHALPVWKALERHDLDTARMAVGKIVGRDTADLAEPDIVRATIETVAESTSDGIVAPLVFLALGGAPLAMAFKAVSTLDSMVGHQEVRYQHFGWASARFDDVANWVPARLTAGLMMVAAGLESRSLHALSRTGRMLYRDRTQHPSPNSGWPESAMAGALDVQLGGWSDYDGNAQWRPHLGEPGRPLNAVAIKRSLVVMGITVLMAVVLAQLWVWG